MKCASNIEIRSSRRPGRNAYRQSSTTARSVAGITCPNRRRVGLAPWGVQFVSQVSFPVVGEDLIFAEAIDRCPEVGEPLFPLRPLPSHSQDPTSSGHRRRPLKSGIHAYVRMRIDRPATREPLMMWCLRRAFERKGSEPQRGKAQPARCRPTFAALQPNGQWVHPLRWAASAVKLFSARVESLADDVDHAVSGGGVGRLRPTAATHH